MKRTKLIALGALVIVGAGAYVLTRGDAGREAWTSVTASVQNQGTGPTAAEAATPANPAKAPAAPPVEVAQASSAEATTELTSIGTLTSDESVSIAPEIPGRISAIGFQEGEHVKAGDVLVTLDVALARADLANAEANYRLAQSNFERATSLSKSGAGTTRARDEAQAALDTSSAALDLAKVRIDKMEIRAPFDGVVGLRSVSVGAYTQIGQALVNLEKIDTLKVDFRLPEINLRDVKVGQTVDISVDAVPGRTFEGKVYAIDPLVDINGRALKVRARLANPDNILRPGLFGRVKLRGAARGQVVMIPEGAIMPRGTGTFVYTVKDGRAVEAKVLLGRRTVGQVEILEGLSADATVVTAGQSRVRNGQPVDIVASNQQQRPS